MIIFNSKEKDRNYHRSKKKFFNHNNIRTSKEKTPLNDQANNVTINLHGRARSPSKKEKVARSPSKGSRKSKNSQFSDQDKFMTRQAAIHATQYNCNRVATNERRRDFKSPEQGPKRNEKMKQRLSEQAKRLQLRSKQLQKQQPNRRKPRHPKLFDNFAQTPKPMRTPPRSPRNDFMQQQGQIDPALANQAQALEGLRQQNQFYKLIYKASLEKMKRLENSIEKEKLDYKKTKDQFEKQLKSLKYKINRADKKVSIGHIYSYDQKQTLKVQPDKIITQTDNEASEITKNNQVNEKRNKKDQLPSKLSIEST